MRLDIRRIGAIKAAEGVVGNRTRVKVVKNKLAPPFREIEFDIMYGEGASHEGLIIDMGVEKNVIDKSGAWLSYRGERIGQGRENAKVFLKEHPDVAARIDAEIREKYGLEAKSGAAPKVAQAPADDEAPEEASSGKNGKSAAASSNGARPRARA